MTLIEQLRGCPVSTQSEDLLLREAADELETQDAEIKNALSHAFNLTPRRTIEDARDDLCAQIQLLHDRLEAQNKRLMEALERIRQWDCMNPPDENLCADHPWLKRLVDAALEGK